MIRITRGLLLELRHDGVLRVHFHGFLGHHVRRHAAIAQILRLRDALRVGIGLAQTVSQPFLQSGASVYADGAPCTRNHLQQSICILSS